MVKLWELYPDIWKTKSSFFTWLRGNIRRAFWEKYPVKFQFKDERCTPPPEDYTGRAKSGAICALTGDWFAKSHLEVDHVEGNVSLNEWEDVLPFIEHMLTTKDNMQLVSKEAHKAKSYAEKQGISFEDAVVEKKAIAHMKKNSGKDFLNSVGLEPESNETKRRAQIVEYLRGKGY